MRWRQKQFSIRRMRKFISPRWKRAERSRKRGGREGGRGREREREREIRAEWRIDVFANVRRVAATPWWKRKIAYFSVQHFPRRTTRPDPPGNLDCGLHVDEIFPVRVWWPRLSPPFSLAGFVRVGITGRDRLARYFLPPAISLTVLYATAFSDEFMTNFWTAR